MSILITYDDGVRIPDVMAGTVLLTPKETPLYSGFRKTKASQTLHEFMEKTLSTFSDNAVPEGASFGTPAQSRPVRRTNITQIFEKVYQVSSTEQWVHHYDTSDVLAGQQQDKLMEIATDIELALLKGSIASGNNAGASARRMAGLLNYITTNATAVNSGTKLTESLYGDMCQLIHDGNGSTIGAGQGNIDEVYTCSRLKRVISSFTADNTKNVQANDRRLVVSTDVIVNDFGMQKLFIHRQMPSTTNSDAAVLFLNRRLNAVAIGDPVHVLSKEEVAQTGHSGKGVIRGELTCEITESLQGQVTGLDTGFPDNGN